MRRVGLAFLFVSSLAGCAHVAPVETVVTLPPPVAAAAMATTPLRCMIHGDGELDASSGVDFDLYPAPATTRPALRIVRTTDVAVTWSELPSSKSAARARVEIGGQKLIRAKAYASLVGRGFQLRRRGYQVIDHVWIDGGVVVELLGAEGDRLVVRRRSGLVEPTFFEARMACSDVAYEPETLEVEKEAEVATSDTVWAPKGVLHLATGAGGASFLTVNVDERTSFGVVERRGASVRILFSGDGVGFDAWVPNTEVDELRHGWGSSGSSCCGGSGRVHSRLVTVTKESAVRIGPQHEVLEDAVFEVDAVLRVLDETEGLFQVEFPHGEIEAPDGMWIAKGAVEE